MSAARANLFILGAPKCGTTALAQWLGSHARIYMAPTKEPHHFSEEYCLTPSRAAYAALFAGANPSQHRYLGEASVWSLYSPTALPNLLRYQPEATCIAMLRSPLEMIPSLHQQQRVNGNELYPCLETALAAHDARMRGEPAGVRSGYPPEHLAYLHSCSLGWQLERAAALLPPQRLYLVFYEDFAADPARVYAELLAYLGLAYEPPPSFARVNSARTRRSFLLDRGVLALAAFKQRLGIRRRAFILARLRRWNATRRTWHACSPAAAERIRGTCAADVARLSEVTGRDCRHWLR